jgi:hypothetical protein
MDAIVSYGSKKPLKVLPRGGIVTSEHINEAIKAWNEHFDDVEALKILKITNPKEEPLFR